MKKCKHRKGDREEVSTYMKENTSEAFTERERERERETEKARERMLSYLQRNLESGTSQK